MAKHMDIAANRRASKWSTGELIGRGFWEILSVPLFAWTPRPMWRWRNFVLRRFGAKVGQDVRVNPSVRIAVPWNVSIGDFSAIGDGAIIYSLGHISIGKRVTISQHAHLCAGSHDYSDSAMPLLKLPIVIEDDVWICADAYIGPAARIGSRAIVAARGVIVKDVPANQVFGGNPGRRLKDRPALP